MQPVQWCMVLALKQLFSLSLSLCACGSRISVVVLILSMLSFSQCPHFHAAIIPEGMPHHTTLTMNSATTTLMASHYLKARLASCPLVHRTMGGWLFHSHSHTAAPTTTTITTPPTQTTRIGRDNFLGHL
jgi:hypothetical protein